MSAGRNILAALKRSTLAGQPIHALLSIEVFVPSGVEQRSTLLASTLKHAADMAGRHGAAAVLPRNMLAFAISSASGAVLEAEPAFTERLGAEFPVSDLSGMVRAAARGHAQLRTLPTRDGGALALHLAPAVESAHWPLPPRMREVLASAPNGVMLVALTATRTPQLEAELRRLFDLTVPEATVVAGLLKAPTVEIAATRANMRPATAREALSRARRKLGAASSGALTRRVLEALLHGAAGAAAPSDAEELAAALGLTPAEARVALATAEGLSAAACAEALGLGVETVKSHLRSAFSKVGVNRSRELARITVEAKTLGTLRRSAEVVALSAETQGRLRLIQAPAARTVAFVDHGGPAGSRLLFACHGFAAGRVLPRPLVERLHGAGWRPVVPQRPGYGLSDPTDADHYFGTAADDMAAIAAALGCAQVDVLARDSSAPALFALCARSPGLVRRAVLLNPKSPAGPAQARGPLLAACSRFLIHNPGVIAPFVEMLRRQLRTDLLRKVLTRSCADSLSDAEAIARPEVMDRLVEDIQALMARSSAGAAAEQSAYVGWTPRRPLGDTRWAVGFSAELGFDKVPTPWADLLGVEPAILPVGGYLVQFSHPEVLLELLGGRAD